MNLQKKISLFLCFFLLITSCFSVRAAETSNDNTSTDTAQALTVDSSQVWPDSPDIESEAAVLMDASTGTILYEKNMNQKMYPASITKIMTCYLALENCSLDETVTFSNDAVFNIDQESSRVGIDVGEQLTMEQCLNGLMLESANEIAYAVAEHVSGSVKKFVKLMNKTAKELGCTNTHFNNPHGLPDEKHYTSAHDMALILKAAIHNDTFRSIIGKRQFICPPTNKQSEQRIWNNHHQMFASKEYAYDGFEGGKTGYTTVALSTLATFAKRGDMELVCITMKANTPGQYTDTAALFNYGFDNFQVLNIAKNESSLNYTEDQIVQANNELFKNTTSVDINKEGNIIIPSSYSFSDATPEFTLDSSSDNDTIARLTYTFAGRTVGTTTVSLKTLQTDGYSFQTKTGSFESYDEMKATKNYTSAFDRYKIYFIIAGIVVVCAAAIVFLILFFRKRKINKRR